MRNEEIKVKKTRWADYRLGYEEEMTEEQREDQRMADGNSLDH